MPHPGGDSDQVLTQRPTTGEDEVFEADARTEDSEKVSRDSVTKPTENGIISSSELNEPGSPVVEAVEAPSSSVMQLETLWLSIRDQFKVRVYLHI